MAKKYKIKVKIAGKEYTFNIDYKDEHVFRKAAKVVDTKYAEYIKIGTLDAVDCLAMIAVESYVINFKDNSKKENELINTKLSELSEIIDDGYDESQHNI
ncbi:MAG: cell division protein ZapA [Rikenellaceae bacterium]